MVVDSNQFNVNTNTINYLGRFGTFGYVLDMDYFRNNLAVKEK